MIERRIQRVGSRAVMVDLPTLADVMNFHAALISEPLVGQVDAIAAARTVLLTFDSPRNARAAAETLDSYNPDAAAVHTPRTITIDVVYDGADLHELDMSAEEIIDWHTSTDFVGAFGGFAPGFTYCVPADPARALNIPRRSSPRTAVPAGAVALAGDFSAVYPRTSPGGWQLIGTTVQPMWDAGHNPPAAIAPGDIVRYRAVDKHPELPATADEPHPADGELALTDTGLLTLLQDLGRQGNGNLGVTTSGAADRAAHRAANEAVGNPATSATLENIGGLTVTARAEVALAATGSGTLRIDGQPIPMGTPVVLPAGVSATIEPGDGLRSYLAVRGGIDAPIELGSRSTDQLSGLGPAPLHAGQRLSTAGEARSISRAVTNPVRSEKVLRCVAGPRADWIAGGAAALADQTWEVSGASNRVGLRLSGGALDRAREGELASEGIVAGSVQVPANGEPVVFLRDHAVTGGYPVVATVIAEDLDIAGQLAPGDTFSFVLVDPDTLS